MINSLGEQYVFELLQESLQLPDAILCIGGGRHFGFRAYEFPAAERSRGDSGLAPAGP